MRRKGSECTRISPAEIGAGTPMLSLASSRSARRVPSSDRDRPRQVRGACGSRLLRKARWTAARFYRRARVSIVRAFRSSSSTTTKKAAAAATAASPDCTPARHSSRRQQQSAPPVAVVDDSHKSEAVEECIRFMNSSSRKYR
ncbi:hypothetical protein BDA96_03G388400 [Sorghum bicolor]|uniref:Josephin-like protein n=2 Tax=Sorghum bicolor TaxID=4558 RepID=A0A921RHX5_SORBI|nr:josephin-like protein [Sorghum bicolor]EES01772.1 hypothetical protein SORBI_3003G360100 [Sorghum bicolor]KAG0540199.1 hypothetical protein BDA96_03G388400 [Sorghum bicolor]|eukprot:XP_002456652.1 josephin-like protein [Sorghum bicolor]